MAPRTRNARIARDLQFPFAGWKVGVYTRASDDAKKTKTSVTDQEAGGLAWTQQQHATHFRTYCDNDLSGSRFATKGRDRFDQLLADVAAGRLQLLWFWKLSRSQRQLRVFAELRDLCRRHDVRWVVDNRVYNLKDRGDRLALGVQALMDEDLPEQISENVSVALASNAQKGRPHGFTPYGWRRIYDEETGKLIAQVVDEAQAAVVQDAARRLLAGETLYGIADALNEAGHRPPRGGLWLPGSIRVMLQRPAYIGMRTYHGVIVGKAIWPRILTDDDFYECRRILTAPERAIEHPMTIKHLLSGIALCQVCDGKLRAYPRDGRLKYQCERPSKCVAIRLDWLDGYIEDLVLMRLADPDAIEWLSRPSQAGDVTDAEKEIETLDGRMQEWYQAGRRGKANPVVVSTMVTQLMADIEEAKRRAAVQLVSPVLREAARPDIAQIWPSYSLPKKRMIIQELVEIRVVPVGRGRGRTFEVGRVPTRWRHELSG